jgi:hypothetical protein
VRAYELQAQKPDRYMRNHRYHEPLDTDDVVLECRADSVCGYTMIHHGKMVLTECRCLPVSDIDRQQYGQVVGFMSSLLLDACRCPLMPDLRYSHSIVTGGLLEMS